VTLRQVERDASTSRGPSSGVSLLPDAREMRAAQRWHDRTLARWVREMAAGPARIVDPVHVLLDGGQAAGH
jgi:hypothetical protein